MSPRIERLIEQGGREAVAEFRRIAEAAERLGE